jgi:hypothetical protein
LSELNGDDSYAFPLDFDDLGRSKGELSYIAVVHADGNGMGKIIGSLGSETNNRDYITKMRNFSQQVKVISRSAMGTVIDLLMKKAIEGKCIQGTRNIADVEFSWDADAKCILPMRPIVFGGDDTTFVCDGRLGLGLATAYLRAFEEKAARNGFSGDKTLTACAGVAVVKSHYPFARAYDLSEELCSSAKKFRHTANIQGSALDWHITPGGLYADLETMRERDYIVSEGALTLRPVSLADEGGARSWHKVEGLTKGFQGDWSERRNKAKLLRDALREGTSAVERFLTIYADSPLPPFSNFDKAGWHDGRCGYFDALELMDLHIPLSPVENNDPSKVGVPS